jgi:hypothetical protein
MAGDGYYTAHTGHYEWYTPINLVDKARQALGGSIELDPFTHPVANEIIQADHIITEQDNALIADWPRVETMFANPPYALGLIGKCARRITQEYHAGTYRRAVIMVNNATEARWFHELLSISAVLCLPAKRINFLNHHRELTIQRNSRGQVIFGVGIEETRFDAAFCDVGAILKNSPKTRAKLV